MSWQITGPSGSGGSANDKGWFATEAALVLAYAVGSDGWYAVVGETDTIWAWDSDTAAWVNTTLQGTVHSFNSRAGVVTPAASDYDADQVDYTPGTVTGVTEVQGAIDALGVPTPTEHTVLVSDTDGTPKEAPATIETTGQLGSSLHLTPYASLAAAQGDTNLANDGLITFVDSGKVYLGLKVGGSIYGVQLTT